MFVKLPGENQRRTRTALRAVVTAGLALLPLMQTGCGTTKSSMATEQLLLSDAVDRSVTAIDFRPLSGKNIFVDTQFVPLQRSPVPNDRTYINTQYVVSSLRQQIMAAGCKLVDKLDDADIVVEPRIGTLAADGHQMSVGIPASKGLNTAAELVPSVPSLPSIPELSLARRETQDAASKVAVFAYDRKTREPVWQSGLSLAQSTARDTWVFGVGPFHRSAIRQGDLLVGTDLEQSKVKSYVQKESQGRPLVDYDTAMVFADSWPIGTGVRQPHEKQETHANSSPADAIKKTDEGTKEMKPSPVVRASTASETTVAEPLPPPSALAPMPKPKRLPSAATNP
jgi:hypothetical protein